MWVLWDTESLQCINISEWFLFHAYISDVTLIFATDYYKACTSMWTWAWAIRVQIYMSNKIRSVKIIWSLGNEQKHSHDFSIHMQLYRVALSGKITMKKCRYRLGLNAMLVLFQVIEIIGSLKCWTTFRCICTLNRIKQSNIHTNNNIKIRCLTMAFFSSSTPCYYPTTTNINSHTTLHR